MILHKNQLGRKTIIRKPTVNPVLQMKVIFVSKSLPFKSGQLSPLVYVMTMFLPSNLGAFATAPTRIKNKNNAKCLPVTLIDTEPLPCENKSHKCLISIVFISHKL